jgi:hypothetical protein
LRKEEDIDKEYNISLEQFLERIANIVEKKNYTFYEIVMTYFEVNYRMKKDIPQKFIDRIFKDCLNVENLREFGKLELIKLTYLLSRYEDLRVKQQDAFESLNSVIQCLLQMDLSALTKSELEAIILNLSYKQINPDLELFTYLEPYILKYLSEYSLQSIVNIFYAYVKSFCGTNFFLQTLGYSISSKLEYCNIIDFNILLELSHPRYFNRPELSIIYSDFFKDVIGYIMGNINDFKFKNYFNLLNGMINVGISNKKYNQLASTGFLRYHELIKFKEYVEYLNLFTKLDIDSDVFWKKCLETLHWNTLCLHNYHNGYNTMDNYIGLFDKKLVSELNKRYMKNIDDIKDELRFAGNVEQINQNLNALCKSVWIITYTLVKYNLKPTYLNDLIVNNIYLFNNYISQISGKKISIEKDTFKTLLFTSIYLNIISKQLNLKSTINLDFLKHAEIIENHENYKKSELESYNQFEVVCRNVIEKTLKVEKVDNKNINKIFVGDLNYLLLPDYLYNDGFKLYSIFINNPLDSFAITFNQTGINKVRSLLCKMLKIVPIDLDYNELKEMNRKDNTTEGLEKLISDYLTITIK